MKKTNIKKLHIVLIIIGILFNCISIFHPNLWFDEAYSVGLANKSFSEIWRIGGNDVHPVLYYWILHIIYLIANALKISMNGTIIAYRVFSAICISCLGILGFTHIKKDFGEKVGIFFTFFSYFMPAICMYTGEVRMYSLAILLVTILAIYAYRLFKNDKNNKNWIIFGLTSLACIFVHYYGLMAAGIINCILLAYLIKEKKKESIIKILSFGAIQLVAYIPWIMCFMKQMKNVAKGFWIGFEFPGTIYELLGTQFAGNVKPVIGFVFQTLLVIYLIYKIIKAKRDKNEYLIGVASISIYILVIVAALVMTLLLKTSIIYYRYLFVITGLFIFFISYFLAKEKNKFIIGLICAGTVIIAIGSNFLQIREAYDKSNMKQITYLSENIQEDDLIVYSESSFGAGAVVGLHFTDNNQIYYNPEDWGVGPAYEAFGKQLEVTTSIDFLNKCTGRIWIIDSENADLYNRIFNNENFRMISQKLIKTKYLDYPYNIILVERVNEKTIDNTGLKFVPKDNLNILTQNQIQVYFGRKNAYEIIAMDPDKKRMVYFLKVNSNDIEEKTAKEYLENTSEEDARNEIYTEFIAGLEFQTIKVPIKRENSNYTIERYAYKLNDEFLVFDYCYPEGESNNFEDMIIKE